MPVSGYVLRVLSETQISRNLNYHIKLLLSDYIKLNWLVVWNIFYFSISYMGCHPSHWRTHMFQDGFLTTNQFGYPFFHRFWIWDLDELEPLKIPCLSCCSGGYTSKFIRVYDSPEQVYRIPYAHYSRIIQQFAIEKSKFWICKSLS